MKIKRNYIHENFGDKPVHIDKLFANEEEFMEKPINKTRKKKKKLSASDSVESERRYLEAYKGCLDPV